MKILVYCEVVIFMLITFCIFGCNQPYDLGVNMQDPFQETQPGDDDAGETDTTTPEPPESIEVRDLDAETIVIGDVEEPEPETGGHELNLEDLAELLPDIEVPVLPGNEENGTAPDPIPDPPKPRDSDPPEIISSNIKDGDEGVGRNDDDDDEISTDTGRADDDDDMDEPEGLNIGDEVVAQNTMGGDLNGLLVRKNAGVNSTRIGGVFDGATGTITDGPEYKDSYTWWKVRWDLSASVICDENPCEGWSVEFFRGSRIIAER